MNILLWYLPYAIFSGARDCDVDMSEGETPADGEPVAESAERKRQTDLPT